MGCHVNYISFINGDGGVFELLSYNEMFWRGAYLTFDSSSGKEGVLSYLEKALAYLQKLQMPGMFPLLSEESAAMSNDRSSVTGDLGNDGKEGMSLYLS